MSKIDFSKLVISTVSFGQTVIHLHTFILQDLLVLLIFQYKSLFGSGLSRLGSILELLMLFAMTIKNNSISISINGFIFLLS